jgi:hypothetical protein
LADGQGLGQDDIFIDLHDMQAGETWRETLVKANVACDGLLVLASPEALDSDECRREVRRAEDDRKDVTVAILRDVRLEDPRLKPWTDRQIMDLSADPLEERVDVAHQSRRYFIDFNLLALEAIHAKLIDWGHAPDSFAWPPKERPNAQPYPGPRRLRQERPLFAFPGIWRRYQGSVRRDGPKVEIEVYALLAA